MNSNENHCLGVGNLEAMTAARVRAEEHVVDANQIVPRFGELGPVVIVGTARKLFLLRPAQPANLELRRFATLWTRISCHLHFRLLSVVITLIHSLKYNPASPVREDTFPGGLILGEEKTTEQTEQNGTNGVRPWTNRMCGLQEKSWHLTDDGGSNKISFFCAIRPGSSDLSRLQISLFPEAGLIEVEHLTKSYGPARAVSDISFKVERGEILGFLGPNGAGKTTTMRILTGYLPATSGSARVAGFDVSEQSLEVRRRIGYLPETPPLYPEMTVRGYLEFVARIKGVASADIPRRVNEALKLATIEDRANELIKRLSRGYRQRVGIAQAIVHNPDVVILDEPTVGLDPKQIIEVRKLIKGLSKDHTVILSTHILPEVSMTCDRVVIINKGKIVAIDTPQNLTSQIKGGERVHLSARGDLDKLRSILGSIDGIERLDVESGPEDNDVSATIESERGLDLRSKIAASVVNGGLDLIELRGVNLSLEEIFLQLTTEEKSAEQEA